ncbi:MAG TPA: aldo/keto reductase [Blastocatellia bacterium]|nr:aldo/keto reductase [Blastocatellia bacterium]HMV83662.1 aldo/keto reductase [Blastocatellia bacterium]HMX30546.1 aldo/keto reductase [Blastocatellia bacterium]HMY76497.1 aldo/keto reductase [Blastocatellia bacterium]HMZ20374.1 aldo/keto reductase [Blastocatellia bacterium]
MNYRTLGRTGIEVSEVGYGAWGIGGVQWTGGDDDEARRSLNLAIDQGLNFIDTALAYGRGHSERLVGEVARARSEQITIATKIPPKNQTWPARPVPLAEVFPADHIIECTETSLRNLGVETIDLQQLHVWHDDWADQPEWIEALLKLREQGKVRYFGISINDYQPANVIKALRTGHIDAVQVIYNIFEQAPQDELYPVCQELNIGVLARVPFDEGGLTGAIKPDTVFPQDDFRSWFFRGDRKQKVFDRVEQLKTLLGEEAATLPELALRFTLSHDAVSTVIPGMRSTKHVTANIACSDGGKLSPELLERLKAFAWDRTGDW